MRSAERRGRRAVARLAALVGTPAPRLAAPVTALVAGLVALSFAAGTVLGESPAPSGVISGDPRSSGQGPGLVGDPATAILAVLLVAIIALALALAYVRATGGPGRTPPA